MSRKQEEKKVILVRNYDSAFSIYIWGQSITSWITDILTMLLFWILVSLGVGKVWPFTILYDYLWETSWSFLVYGVLPGGITLILILLKERGIGVWPWLFNNLRRSWENNPQVPFEPRQYQMFGRKEWP
ncbi:hypothetical protein GXN76_02030 [Kroppenstedtia pulmonis]|uniref:Uncharacterized protein n=1 Tax=Kroppenstedtia pulmonis TaxID=1380685 RepID=A0A7D4B158_9BACL|nr:hypothetical protein [Kroppenstedtia pulmonis]QKG83366.1 hypothetical protein GXN76_02030 [Kroppenstedtia pulmonis]